MLGSCPEWLCHCFISLLNICILMLVERMQLIYKIDLMLLALLFCIYIFCIPRLIYWWCSQWQKSVLQYVNWEASGYLATAWWVPHATLLFYFTCPVMKYHVVLDHVQSRWMLSIKYLGHALPQSCPRHREREPIIKLLKVLSVFESMLLFLCIKCAFVCVSLLTFSTVLLFVLYATVGEATDDGEWEKEDHVFSHLPRHRHHLRCVVALCSNRQNSRGDQTRSALTQMHTHA